MTAASVVRFSEEQLIAKTPIEEALTDTICRVNLAPTTPEDRSAPAG